MSGDEVEIHEDGDEGRPILVLAHEGLGGERLLGHVRSKDSEASAEVFVTVPALSRSLKPLANDDPDEIARAGEDLKRPPDEVEGSGRTAAGIIGDSRSLTPHR